MKKIATNIFIFYGGLSPLMEGFVLGKVTGSNLLDRAANFLKEKKCPVSLKHNGILLAGDVIYLLLATIKTSAAYCFALSIFQKERPLFCRLSGNPLMMEECN